MRTDADVEAGVIRSHTLEKFILKLVEAIPLSGREIIYCLQENDGIEHSRCYWTASEIHRAVDGLEKAGVLSTPYGGVERYFIRSVQTLSKQEGKWRRK